MACAAEAPLIRTGLGLAASPGKTLYEAWNVSWELFPNGSIKLQLGAKSGPGLTVFDLRGFAGWLSGAFPTIPLDGPDGWHVAQWELNRDFPGLRLEGAQAMTIRQFGNVLIKVYQKAGQGAPLRLEVRQWDVHLSLPSAIEILRKATLGFLEEEARLRREHEHP